MHCGRSTRVSSLAIAADGGGGKVVYFLLVVFLSILCVFYDMI